MKYLLFLTCLLLSFPAAADFESGRRAYMNGEYDKAFQEWQKAADDGDLAAQRNLGHLYRWGKGVPQDLTQAAFWYYTAAKGGSDTAQYNLGIMYLRGEGIPRNEDEGIIWLTRAAEQKNKKAVQKLAHLKTEIDQELPTEDDLLVPVKSEFKSLLKGRPVKMTPAARKKPPLYAHLASYYDQGTLEKGWKELQQTFPELSGVKTVETRVTLPEKGKYIRLYIKGTPEKIRDICEKLNARKQYCLISYP